MTTITEDNIQENKDDNGYYYGAGIRINISPTLSIYGDGAHYYLDKSRVRIIDAEIGFRYQMQ